jgi:hypothetical protein
MQILAYRAGRGRGMQRVIFRMDWLLDEEYREPG